MDVVYLCRAGNHNEELRYSLRSLVNLPHDRVFIAGGWPRWVSGVQTIKVGRAPGSSYGQTSANLRAAVAADISERFVVMNDDFFIMRGLEEIPVWHKGSISEVTTAHKTRSYAAKLQEVGDWLGARGYPTLCYELHIPMVLERARVIEAMALDVPSPASDFAKRSVYGNVFAIGGERHRDVKVLGDGFSEEWPFLSTTDAAFTKRAVGQHIRSRFSDPSPYEGALS